MKSILPTTIAFTVAAVPMFAGKRIQFETTDLTTNKVTSHEILLDADRLRINDADSVVMFLTKGGERLVILDKKTNTYREMDQAYMDQMAQQMGAINAQMKGMSPEQQAQMEAMMAQMMKGKAGAALAAQTAATTYTAKGSGTVAGIGCTNYDGVKQGAKVAEICAAQPAALKLSASDFQVLDKIRQFSARATSNMPQGLGQMVPRMSITESGINGMPISTTHFENGKATSKEQLKAITDTAFSDADFSTGTATKQEMPMPGARPSPKGKGK
jgi:hypothetical protein